MVRKIVIEKLEDRATLEDLREGDYFIYDNECYIFGIREDDYVTCFNIDEEEIIELETNVTVYRCEVDVT